MKVCGSRGTDYKSPVEGEQKVVVYCTECGEVWYTESPLVPFEECPDFPEHLLDDFRYFYPDKEV
jgi:hypothetical protein